MSIISALTNRRSNKETHLSEKKVSDMSANGSSGMSSPMHHHGSNNNNTSNHTASLQKAPSIKGVVSSSPVASSNSSGHRGSSSSAPVVTSYKPSFQGNMQDAKLPQVSYYEEFNKSNSRVTSPKERKEASFPPAQQISLAAGKRSSSSPYLNNNRDGHGDDVSKNSASSAPISLVAAMRSRFESLSSPQPTAPAAFSSEEVKVSSPSKSPQKKKKKERKHSKEHGSPPSEEKEEKKEKKEKNKEEGVGKARRFGSSKFTLESPEGETPDLLQSQSREGADSKSSFTRRPRRGSKGGKSAQSPASLTQDGLREISLSLDDDGPRPLSRHASTLSTSQVNALKRTPSFLSRSHTPPPSALREAAKRSHRRQVTGEESINNASLSGDVGGTMRSSRSGKTTRRASLESSKEMKNVNTLEMNSMSGTLASDLILSKPELSKSGSGNMTSNGSPSPGTLRKASTAPAAPKKAVTPASDVTGNKQQQLTASTSESFLPITARDAGSLSSYANPILNASLSKSTTQSTTDNTKSPGASPNVPATPASVSASVAPAPSAPKNTVAKTPAAGIPKGPAQSPASPLTKLAPPPASPSRGAAAGTAAQPTPTNAAAQRLSRSTDNSVMLSVTQKDNVSSLMGSTEVNATPTTSRKTSMDANIGTTGANAPFSPPGFSKSPLAAAVTASAHKQPPAKPAAYTLKTAPARGPGTTPEPDSQRSSTSRTKTEELSMSFEPDALDSFGAHFSKDRSPLQTPSPASGKAAPPKLPVFPSKAPATTTASPPSLSSKGGTAGSPTTTTAAAGPVPPPGAPVIMHRPGHKKEVVSTPVSDVTGNKASPTAATAKGKDTKGGTPASLKPTPPANNSARGGGRQVHTYVEDDDIFETVQPSDEPASPPGKAPATDEDEEEEDEEDEEDLLVGFKPEGFDAKSGARKNSSIVFYITHEDSFSSAEDMVGDSALFASKTDLYMSSSVLDALGKNKDKAGNGAGAAGAAANKRKIGPKITLDDYKAPQTSTTATPRPPSGKPRQGNPYYAGNSSNKSMLSSQRSLTSLTMDAYGLSSGGAFAAKNTMPKALKSIYGGTSSRFAPDPKKMHRPVANTFGSRRRAAAAAAAGDDEDEEDEEEDEEWYWEEVENEEESEEEDEEDEEEEDEPPIVRRAPPLTRKTST